MSKRKSLFVRTRPKPTRAEIRALYDQGLGTQEIATQLQISLAWARRVTNELQSQIAPHKATNTISTNGLFCAAIQAGIGNFFKVIVNFTNEGDGHRFQLPDSGQKSSASTRRPFPPAMSRNHAIIEPSARQSIALPESRTRDTIVSRTC